MALNRHEGDVEDNAACDSEIKSFRALELHELPPETREGGPAKAPVRRRHCRSSSISSRIVVLKVCKVLVVVVVVLVVVVAAPGSERRRTRGSACMS